MLSIFLLAGLAAAQEGSPPAPSGPPPGLPAPARQPVTGTDSIVPDSPVDAALPPSGRVLWEPETPAWVVDLMARSDASGLDTSELTIAKAAAAQAFNGGVLVYTLTVTNTSQSVTIRNLLLRDVLPRGALRDLVCRPNNCERVDEGREIPDPLGGTITVTETRELSWIVPTLTPGQRTTRVFYGTIVGQSDGALLKNQAFARYHIGDEERVASSNEVQTTILVATQEGGGAAISRAPTWFSSDRGGTLSLDWGDYDRDGDLDLALASSIGTTIYRNEGGQLQRLWSNTRLSFGVRWGDFNGDGRLELVVVGDRINDLGVNYLYTVSGATVQESGRFTSTRQLVRVVPGDYDGDGDLDLVVSTNAINAPCPVILYNNDGNATFTPAAQCVSNRATASIGAGDADNDGDLDLALGLFPNLVQMFNNDGRGNFSAGPMIDNSAAFLPYDFAWGDYNGDGYLDLAAAYPLLRQARVYANQSGAGFAPPITLRTERFLTPFSLDWGDFTGDGQLDLAVGDLAPAVFTYRDGTFVHNPQLTTDSLSGQMWALRGADVDMDGDLDLTLTNQSGPSLIFTNFAPVLTSELTPVPSTTGLATAPAASVVWGDLNGDSYLDLLFAAGPSEVGTKRFLNRRSVFAREDEAALEGFGPHVVAVGDANKDSNVDIAIGTAQNVVIYLAGNHQVADWSSGTLSGRPTALAWGDADDDGDLDLLVATENGFLHLFRNDTTGTGSLAFTQVYRSPDRLNARSIAWADVNGDAYLDFAVGIDGGTNQVFLNERGKSANRTAFTRAQWTPSITDDATRAVAWVDYDGDGDLDLSVGNYGQPNYIYANVGSATAFSLSVNPVWQSTALSRTTALAWGDWDNDGDLDLAVGNDGEADQVYANRSGQLFWLWRSPETQATTGVAWGDVDNDGDLDLAVSQGGGGRNGYYKNTLIMPAHLEDEYAGDLPLPRNPLYLSVQRPGQTDNAGPYSSPEVLSGPRHPTVPVALRLHDPNGDRSTPGSDRPGRALPLSALTFQYSLNGGGSWRNATPARPLSPTQRITPTRLGTDYTFVWNAQADRAIGEDARFRVMLAQSSPAGPVSRGMASAVSPPFRVRGTTCLWPANARIMAPSGDSLQSRQSLRFVGGVEATGLLTFTWDFGDNSRASGQVVHHQYGHDGTYVVRLTVSGEPCPINRPQVVTQTLKIGSGHSPLFMPLIFNTAQPGSTRSALPPPLPAQVAGLAGAEDGDGILLTWDAALDPRSVTSYRIYRSSGGDFHPIAQVPAHRTLYRDVDPPCGSAYWITAVGPAGEGAASDRTFYAARCEAGD